MKDSRLVIFAHGSPDIRWRLPFEELTTSLIERHGAEKVRLAYMEFVRPSLLNVAWSALFFRLRSPGLAFAEIVMLWFAILATLIEFWRAVPAAGWLLLPYLIWVSYATALNFSIWRLNT